jgi:hypothetical protein
VVTQHPVEQFAGPQTGVHAPLHVSPVVHRSHIEPFEPHAATVFPGWHVLSASQQPPQVLLHDVTHCWSSQVWLLKRQSWQVAPPAPQALSDVPPWHKPVYALQQPAQVPHVLATHWPLAASHVFP